MSRRAAVHIRRRGGPGDFPRGSAEPAHAVTQLSPCLPRTPSPFARCRAAVCRPALREVPTSARSGDHPAAPGACRHAGRPETRHEPPPGSVARAGPTRGPARLRDPVRRRPGGMASASKLTATRISARTGVPSTSPGANRALRKLVRAASSNAGGNAAPSTRTCRTTPVSSMKSDSSVARLTATDPSAGRNVDRCQRPRRHAQQRARQVLQLQAGPIGRGEPRVARRRRRRRRARRLLHRRERLARRVRHLGRRRLLRQRLACQRCLERRGRRPPPPSVPQPHWARWSPPRSPALDLRAHQPDRHGGNVHPRAPGRLADGAFERASARRRGRPAPARASARSRAVAAPCRRPAAGGVPHAFCHHARNAGSVSWTVRATTCAAAGRRPEAAVGGRCGPPYCSAW